MAQYARPDSDVSNPVPTWSHSGYASDIYTAIDESSASDTDYIQASPAGLTYEAGLSNVVDPASSSGHTVRVRHKKSTASARTLTVALYQGTTLIKSIAHSPTNGSWTTTSTTLSSAEADSITDYTDLRLRFTSSGVSADVQVSWVEFEVPDIPAQTVYPTGFANTSAVGSPTLSPRLITLDGFANASAVGSPTISHVDYAYPTGLANVSAFGTPMLFEPYDIDELLADPADGLAFRLVISSRDTDTDTEYTEYASSPNDGYSTTASEAVASATFVPCVQSAGSLLHELSEDILYSGLAQQALGAVTLLNVGGALDYMASRSYAGRTIECYIGKPQMPHATYTLLYTAKVLGEPVHTPTTVTMELQSVSGLLDVPIHTARFVGTPTCLEILTTAGEVTASHNAAYLSTSWTIVARVRGAVAGSSYAPIFVRGSGTSRAWELFQYHASHADAYKLHLNIDASDGSVLVNETTDYAYPNALAPLYNFTTIVVGVLDSTTYYWMVDGEIVATAPITKAPANPSSTIEMLGQNATQNAVGMSGIDFRIYNYYLTPDEALSETATIATGAEAGIVAAWRFDDGAGTSVADASATNNDATVAGVENTAFRWTAADEGEAELAGTFKPYGLGAFFNAPGLLIDEARERFHRTGEYVTSAAAVRDQGTLLVETTDYTIETLALEMVAPAGEPVTLSSPTGETLAEVLSLLLTGWGGAFWGSAQVTDPYRVTRPTNVTPDPTSNIQLYFGLPASVGYFANDAVTVAEAVGQLLAGSGAHAFQTTDGYLGVDVLRSPVGRDDGAVLEFLSVGYIPVPTATPTGNFTMAVRLCPAPYMGSGDRVAIGGWYEGIDGREYGIQLTVDEESRLVCNVGGGGVIGTGISPSEFTSPPNVVKPDVWQFAGVVYDDTAKTLKLYHALDGEDLKLVASYTGITGTPASSSYGYFIGQYFANLEGGWIGGLRDAQVWNAALSVSDLQDIMDGVTVLDGSEANLDFYLPLNDGYPSTTCHELVSDTYLSNQVPADAGGYQRWSPRLTIDLAMPGTTLESLRRLVPAANITLNYRTNHAPLDPANIDALVDANTALALQRPHSSVMFRSQTVTEDYGAAARSIVVDSPLYDEADARNGLRLFASRLADGHYQAIIGLTPHPTSATARQALRLTLNDEVRVIDSSGRYAGVLPRTFRVVSLAPDYGTLSNRLILWG